MSIEIGPHITVPPASGIWSAPSYRRYLLDALLSHHQPLMSGVIVDLGGKRTNLRGAFRPPTAGVDKWIAVNLASDVGADIVADVCAVPLESGSADVVLMCETLEHVRTPQRALAEAYRLLKPGGVFICSVPFLFPVHADPSDFTRWTADGLASILTETAFEDLRIYGMGASLGTLGLLLDVIAQARFYRPSGSGSGKPWLRAAGWALSRFGRSLSAIELRVLDASIFRRTNKLTTGYFLTASKSSERLA
jgi:SAM-dependent methyltransferase